MMKRLSILASVLLSMSVAQAVGAVAQEDGRISVNYEELSPSDPRTTLLWSDVRDLIAKGGDAVKVLSYTLPTSNQGSFVIQVLTGGGMCGLSECTVRIAEDDVPVADFSACLGFDTHELSIDGTKFYACGVETDLTEAGLPAGLVRQQ